MGIAYAYLSFSYRVKPFYKSLFLSCFVIIYSVSLLPCFVYVFAQIIIVILIIGDKEVLLVLELFGICSGPKIAFSYLVHVVGIFIPSSKSIEEFSKRLAFRSKIRRSDPSFHDFTFGNNLTKVAITFNSFFNAGLSF